MSIETNEILRRLFKAPTIAYHPMWKADNHFADAITGEYAPKLEIGQVVTSRSVGVGLIIQGTELGNILIAESATSSASTEDSTVEIHYSEAVGVRLEELFGRAHLLEVLEYLFAGPNNFGKSFLNFNPEIREPLLALHAAGIQSYDATPSAPMNERLGYYRYGSSEVILIKKGETEFIVSERRVSDNYELPIYSISSHETGAMAVAEFKRAVGNLLG